MSLFDEMLEVANEIKEKAEIYGSFVSGEGEPAHLEDLSISQLQTWFNQMAKKSNEPQVPIGGL
jgi:hypothetical protein